MKKETLFSKLRNSKIPKYLMISSLSLSTLFLSPLEKVITREINNSEQINKINELEIHRFEEEYKDLVLQPYEHKLDNNEYLYNLKTILDENQLKRDIERYEEIKNFNLLYDYQSITYEKENNDFLINYFVDRELTAKTYSIIKYLGGFNKKDSKAFDKISLVKLLNESKIFLKEGLPESSDDYEILYNLPVYESKNLGGIKNPITFSYPLRMLQNQDLRNYDLRRQKLFQSSSLKEIIEKIDSGYENQSNIKLNEMYKTNPANILGKAKIYSTIALNEINELPLENKLKYFEKTFDLIKESKELFNNRDTEWYKYLDKTYGEEGINQFNKQMLILYSTTLMPVLYERHNLDYEDINLIEKRDEFIVPMIEDYFQDDYKFEKFVLKLNQVLWQEQDY